MYRQRLGDAVREARMNLDLSQNTLAERSHVSLRTISDIETYKANPRFDSLCSLASYLNISIDAVIKDRKNNSGSTTMQQILVDDAAVLIERLLQLIYDLFQECKEMHISIRQITTG